MTQYTFVAQDGKGKTVTGELDAADRSSAIANIKNQHLQPITIMDASKKPGGKLSLAFGKKGVKSDDLVLFTRELSAMVSAGVPLLRSLASLEEHTTSDGLKNVLGELIKDIQSGTSLADAMGKHPNVFNDVYTNMVRAGEAAGILDDILKRLALQQEKNASMRKKIKSAMTYPIVLLGITVLSFFGLMLFVIPQIGKIIKDLGGADAELPLLTQIMLEASSFMINFWYLLIPGIIGAIYGVIRYTKTPEGKRIFHTIILKLPGIKTIAAKIAVARFARTFSALMGAGVAVLESLSVTAHAVGNVVYEQILLDAIDEVKNGKTLSSVVGKNELFPPIVSQMLSVGEETGQTDTVLLKVADFFEEEVDTAIDGISSIIEPVMIVVMGGMVGLIAASVMMPIAGLSNQIK
ncbi:MAG: type II secretion system F family protein [Candidatus Saccharimonadaceae bacterium]